MNDAPADKCTAAGRFCSDAGAGEASGEMIETMMARRERRAEEARKFFPVGGTAYIYSRLGSMIGGDYIECRILRHTKVFIEVECIPPRRKVKFNIQTLDEWGSKYPSILLTFDEGIKRIERNRIIKQKREEEETLAMACRALLKAFQDHDPQDILYRLSDVSALAIKRTESPVDQPTKNASGHMSTRR